MNWTAADLANKPLPPQPGIQSVQPQQAAGKNAAKARICPKSRQSESDQQSGQVMIGIDPGSVVTGFACIIENQPPILLGFKSHCEALLHALAVVQHYGQQNVHFVIEDARKAVKNAWFAKKNGHSKDKGTGYVMALSKDWQMFCEKVAKVSFTLIAPNPARTKWEADRFERETGIKTKKGEHHLRDAFLLVYPAI